MSECWTVKPISLTDWAGDGLGTACVSDVCRYDNAVLGFALLGAALLGVPCDNDFKPPPPTFDTTAVADRAIAGAAIANTP